MGPGASNSGQTAIKVIVAAGVLAFLFLILSATALKRFTSRDEGQQVKLGPQASLFRGDRAFRDLERIVALGPRAVGTDGHASVRDLIRSELGAAGLDVQNQPFRVETTEGPRSLNNLWCASKGTAPGTVILVVHYDAAPVDDPDYVGANGSACGIAWLLEMARTLGTARDGCTVWCVFLDGSQPLGEDDQGLHGSAALVARLRERRQLADIKAVICPLGLGDRYLGVRHDAQSPRWLVRIVWDPAAELGYDRNFLTGSRTIQGSHLAFRGAGVPSMALVDAEYGGSALQHTRLWHTSEDTVDHVAVESLQAVGDVIYHALSRIDARLSAGAQGKDGLTSRGNGTLVH
ncbi:MAG: M28 family peptidase [bacterium]|nr:M28 family peptidase [bacterium]